MNRKIIFWGIITIMLLFVAVGTVSAQTYTDTKARQVLSIAGISVNSSEPTTSLEGIRTSTLNAIVELNRLSGANITITAGTESGHASGTYSHANGYKVDLRKNSTLDNYIRDNFTSAGKVGGYSAYKDSSGNVFVDEGNHWDVTVY